MVNVDVGENVKTAEKRQRSEAELCISCDTTLIYKTYEAKKNLSNVEELSDIGGGHRLQDNLKTTLDLKSIENEDFSDDTHNGSFSLVK